MGAEDIFLMNDFLRDFSRLDFREQSTIHQMLAYSRHMDVQAIKEVLGTAKEPDKAEKFARIKRWIGKKIEKTAGDYHEYAGKHDWTMFSPKKSGVFPSAEGEVEIMIRTRYETLEHYVRRVFAYAPGNESAPSAQEPTIIADLTKLLEQQARQKATFPQVKEALKGLPLKQRIETLSAHYGGTIPLSLRSQTPIKVELTVTDGIPDGMFRNTDIGKRVQIELYLKCDKPDSHYRLA